MTCFRGNKAQSKRNDSCLSQNKREEQICCLSIFPSFILFLCLSRIQVIVPQLFQLVADICARLAFFLLVLCGYLANRDRLVCMDESPGSLSLLFNSYLFYSILFSSIWAWTCILRFVCLPCVLDCLMLICQTLLHFLPLCIFKTSSLLQFLLPSSLSFWKTVEDWTC